MPTPARNTIVIDNGGHRCRVGFAGEAEPRRTMMNGMAKSKTEHKTFVADQVEKAKDFSALQYRPRSSAASSSTGTRRRRWRARSAPRC